MAVVWAGVAAGAEGLVPAAELADMVERLFPETGEGIAKLGIRGGAWSDRSHCAASSGGPLCHRADLHRHELLGHGRDRD